MRGIFFVAMLYCMGAAGTIITVHTFYENIDWKLHGIPANMVLSETQRKIVIAPSDMSTQFLDVKYVSAQGNLLVRQQILSGPNAHALLDGRSIPLTYIKGNPMRIRYGDDDSPSPWGWLILTIGAFFAAFVGKKMLHKQAGET